MSSPPPLAIRPRATPWWRAERDVLSRFAARAVDRAPGGPLLKTDLFDEASGPYHHAARVPARLRFVGVDLDAGVANAARARLAAAPGACIVADIRQLPFGDGTIALVLSLSTLDHFDAAVEIARSLGEIHRVLAPGGRLVLTLDNPANPEVALRARLPAPVRRRLRADSFPLGITAGTRRTRRMLEDAGFEIERMEYLLHCARYPMIRALGWLERRAGAAWARRGERLVTAAEALGRLPTRAVTAHYVGWIAAKPGHMPRRRITAAP